MYMSEVSKFKITDLKVQKMVVFMDTETCLSYKQTPCSMAIHLSKQHPEYRGDLGALIFSVTHTGPKPLQRQVQEAIQIANTAPTMVMNSRAEYIRPVIQRLAPVDLLDDRQTDRRPGT